MEIAGTMFYLIIRRIHAKSFNKLTNLHFTLKNIIHCYKGFSDPNQGYIGASYVIKVVYKSGGLSSHGLIYFSKNFSGASVCL